MNSPKEVRGIPADLVPWTHRIPEPILALETADEYTRLAEVQFVESDKAFAAELALFVPHGAVVVDVGCGPAIQDVELARLRPDIRFFVVDLDPEMLAEARKKAEEAGMVDRFQFVQANMTQLHDLGIPSNSVVISNTALHELGELDQLTQTFEGITQIVGQTGGCMVRDLRRPANALQARAWRAEVLGEGGDANLSARGIELFTNSQRAGFSADEFQAAIDATSLRARGEVLQFGAPQSRYIMYKLPPTA